MKIIGIGGLPRSGKDTVAELIIAGGWFGISFGDVVRGFAFKRHADEPDPISVANMTETSNWLRETRGPDVILKEALIQFDERQKNGHHDKGLVLWSVRAPVEVDFILSHGGQLIWVEANDKVRHERGVVDLRKGEMHITLLEFKRQEALQWKPQPGIPKDVQMDISYVKDHATKVIENNGNDKAEFINKTKEAIRDII